MCRSNVLLVLDMCLVCATSLKVDFGTDNQRSVKDFLNLANTLRKSNVILRLYFGKLRKLLSRNVDVT